MDKKQKEKNKVWHDRTLAVRSGSSRSQLNEHSQALFLTSSFVFDNAQQGADLFANPDSGNIYSRFTNPTIDALAKKVAALENAEYGLVTSSGMSAIMAVCLSLLKSGDHIVCSRDIFGTSVGLFRDVITRFGIEVDFVPLNDLSQWQNTIRDNTRFLFCETPSNPLLEVIDLPALAKLAHQANALLIVDNCVATPILQKPINFGADIVIHSMTKFMDGGGRCLGGAIVMNDKDIRDKIFSVVRTTGPTPSPFNAWVIFKSLETLPLRMLEQSKSAEILVNWLEQQPIVKKVYHPSATTYAQKEIFNRQMKASGALLSFEVEGGKKKAWEIIDDCQLFSRTANFGDVRSTICHPATTTHNRLTQKMRDEVGVSDDLVRLSIGLEDSKDLCEDLAQSLNTLG
jgi:O-succinylhomoserine sulfhydrylase